MEMNPLVLLHIVAGAVALASGALAAALRKGSSSHVSVGRVFTIAMLAMSATGAWVAWFAPAAASVVAGLLTFYLVLTGWMTLRIEANTAGAFEVIAAAAAFAIAVYAFTSGAEASVSSTGMKDGFPPAIYYVFGSVAAFAASLDLACFVRGGVAGKQRVARHLWRMLFGLLMATSSFFLGQMALFPEPLRKIEILALPVFAVIALLVFWPVRVLLWRKRSGGTPATG